MGALGGQGGGPASGDASAMIKHFEGFTPSAKWDVNHYRVGYGSDTQNGQEVTQSTTTTREAAETDLAERIKQIQSNLEKEIGASWARLSAAAKASLTDMAYNYGDLAAKKPGVITAARGGNERGIADEMIRSMGDNNGVNSMRRLAEARNIQNAGAAAPAGAAALDPKLIAESNAAIDAEKQKIQDAADAQAGGNAVAKAQADILARNAAGQKDSVKDAREMVTAWQAVLSTSHSQEKVLAAQNGLHRAQVALAEKLVAVEKSKNDLAAKDAETPAQKRDAGMAAADLAYKSAGGDVAAQNAALAQKKAVQDTYDKAIVAMAKETENTSYAVAKAALDKREALVKADLAMHTISNAQKAQDDQRILAEREALENAHYAKLRDLETRGTLEYQAAQDKLTQITAQESTKRAQIEAQDAEKIATQYRSVFDSIGGDLSSSIMGMINHTETFRQAMGKLATDVLKMFIDMGMKMVMNWIANQTQMVVMTAIGETQQTGAVAAGVAARTGLTAAGSAASVGEMLVAAGKAIMTDAGQTAAGVTAFLAPFLGPAAIPVGTAAGATVAGMVNKFDIGAYQIDKDQLAMVHRNELVMPAAQAGAFREMLNNAASGRGPVAGAGGSAGGDTHVHLNVSALDAGSVKNWFGANSRQIMQAMHHAIRNGDHIGLKGFRNHVMTDQEREEIAAEIAAQIGSVMAAANLEACAVIAALAERQMIVPARVAEWAKFSPTTSPAAQKIVPSMALWPRAFASLRIPSATWASCPMELGGPDGTAERRRPGGTGAAGFATRPPILGSLKDQSLTVYPDARAAAVLMDELNPGGFQRGANFFARFASTS